MSRLAIIGGQGALPKLLADRLMARGESFMLAEMQGCPAEVPGVEPVRFRLERLVPFLDHLAQAGVGRIVLAGAVRRPKIEPEFFDARTAALVPQLAAAMQTGDDAALRGLIAILEDWGFDVVGAEAIAPDLVPGPGMLAGATTPRDEADAVRAAAIVAMLGSVDVGQGAVVAGGQCLAVEALPGTDAMLASVAAWRTAETPGGGILYKAPKPGQERRADLPALGPATVECAARAGLAGIGWEAGGVLLLDREATVAAAEARRLFLWSRAP